MKKPSLPLKQTILDAAVRPEDRLRLGTALSAISKEHDITNADVEALEQSLEHVRDSRPVEPYRFE